MTTDDALTFLKENLGRVKFVSVYNTPRVVVWLPGWEGYYVERDTFIEAVIAAKERQEHVECAGTHDYRDA